MVFLAFLILQFYIVSQVTMIYVYKCCTDASVAVGLSLKFIVLISKC